RRAARGNFGDEATIARRLVVECLAGRGLDIPPADERARLRIESGGELVPVLTRGDCGRAQLIKNLVTFASSSVAPSPGCDGTDMHPSDVMRNGSWRKKSRRSGVQPGGS